MTNLRSLRSCAFLALLGASLTGACDDDDNDGGGRAGASQGGDASGGAGEPQGGDAGASVAGASTEGGTAATAGGGAAGDVGTAGAGGGSTVATLSDAQILLVLETLNQGEVEEAYAALPRLSAPDVRAFAEQMVTDHGSAREDVAATAEALSEAPVPSEPQAELKGESEARVATLRAASTTALDATYIDLQVDVHAAALALLDELAEVANAAELTTLIAMLRATVQQHYDHALELRETTTPTP